MCGCLVVGFSTWLLGLWLCGCLVVALSSWLLGFVGGWLFGCFKGWWVATRKTEIQIRRRAESEASIYAPYTV